MNERQAIEWLRTDGGKSRLCKRVGIKSCLATYEHPVERIANIGAIPFYTVTTPPRVIHLCGDNARLIRGVFDLRVVQYLLAGITVEKEDVNEIGLCDFRTTGVPWSKVSTK